MNKKIVLSLASLPCVSVGMAFCGCTTNQQKSPEEKQKACIVGDKTLSIGQHERYTVDLESDKNVQTYWQVDKPEMADIKSDGELTAKKAGEFTLTAYDNRSFATSMIITVSDEPQPEGVIVDGPTEVKLGTTVLPQYTAQVVPSGASQEVTWSVSPSDYATIDESGRLTPLKAGDIKVRATTVAEPHVIKSLGVSIITNPESIKISGPKQIALNQEFDYTATFFPEKSIHDLIWSVDNPELATIDQDSGHLVPIRTGQITITAQAKFDPAIKNSHIVDIYDYYVSVIISPRVGDGHIVEQFSEPVPNVNYSIRFVSKTYEIEEDIEMPIHKQLKKSDLEVVINSENKINECTLENNVLTIPANLMGTNPIQINLLGAEIAEWIGWDIIKNIADKDLKDDEDQLAKSLFEVGDYKTMWDGATNLGYAKLIDFYHDEYDEETSEHVIIAKQAPFTFQIMEPNDLKPYSNAQHSGGDDEIFTLPEWQTLDCLLHIAGLDMDLWNEKYHLPIRMVNKNEKYRDIHGTAASVGKNDDPETDPQSILFVPSYTELTGYPQFKIEDVGSCAMPEHSNPNAPRSNDTDRIYAFYDEQRYISTISLHTKLSRNTKGGGNGGWWIRNIQNVTTHEMSSIISWDYNYWVSYDGTTLEWGSGEDDAFKRIASWLFCI